MTGARAARSVHRQFAERREVVGGVVPDRRVGERRAAGDDPARTPGRIAWRRNGVEVVVVGRLRRQQAFGVLEDAAVLVVGERAVVLDQFLGAGDLVGQGGCIAVGDAAGTAAPPAPTETPLS